MLRRKRNDAANAGGQGGLTLEDVDVWAMRDCGFVRSSDIPFMRDHFEVEDDIVADYDELPSDEQRQFVMARYEEIASHLCAIGFDGRSDWTPLQAWSMGRAATAKLWGHEPEETLLPVVWGATRK